MAGRFTGLVTALAVVLAGCVAAPPLPTDPPSVALPSTQEHPFSFADLPSFDGSTANIPLISLVIQRLTGASQAEADNLVEVSTTPNAYRALVAGSTDVLLVYEADAALQQEIKDSGVALESHPIGRDGLVFFTNAANPVASLTTEQFRGIYTGAITNWQQVGGDDAEIIAYQRPEDSGSQAQLRKHVMGATPMAKAPTERITADMGEIVEGVSGYANTANALGYSVYYYLANMYAADGIKMLAVSGVMPSSQTIGTGEYPYVNDFFVIIRADEPAGSPARRVLEWLLSAEGRQAVVEAGYVPVG